MAGIDSYTKIMLHGDGIDGATTFVDEMGGSWSCQDSLIELDTAQKKFGSASFLLGSSDYDLSLDGGLTSALNPGAGDFTFDLWVRFNTLPEPGSFSIFELHEGGSFDNILSLSLYEYNPGACSLEGYASANGSSLGYFNSSDFELSVNTWYHIEFCRYGNTYLMFLAGALIGSNVMAAHEFFLSSGSYKILYSDGVTIWCDEIRYSVGIARHTTNFTPSTEAYAEAVPQTYEESIEDSLGLSDGTTSPIEYDMGIDESLGLDDIQDNEWTLAGGHFFDQNISDDLGVVDEQSAVGNFPNAIDESIDVADSDIFGWPMALADGMTIVDSHAICWPKTIEEILFIYEELKHGWGVSISEDLTLTDSLSYVLGLMISDWITLIDTQTNNWNGREIVPDTLNLYDIATGGKKFADTIDESLVVTDESLYKLTVTVLEYLGFTDLANAVRTGSETVSDTVTMADTPAHALSFLIDEALSVVDANSVIAAFIHTVAESLDLTDTASPIKKIYETATDPLVFTETVSSQGHLYSAVYDTLAMNITVELNGEVYECYVLNTPKFHPSMYSGFDFNSYCVFENRAFGANDTGIYELTGDTDAGATIHTGAILSQTDFGAPNQKRFRHGYLGISGTSPVMVFECEDGTRQAYSIDTKGHVVASSELKSKKWVLSIADYESLDTIKLLPIILTK